jgi:thiopeptide-type bacteriocin biosynthesis protein
MRAPAHHAVQIIAEIKRLVKPHLKNGLVTDFTIATYQPELKRYGLAGMENVEKIFELSSEAVVNFYKTQKTLDEQICFAISSIVEILSVMFSTLNERLQFAKNGDQIVTKSVSKRVELDKYYRHYKHHLECAAGEPASYYGNLIAQKIQELGEKCKAIKDIGQLTSKDRYDLLVSDLIHMHLNRLNRTGSSAFETDIYYFLAKYYRSLVGRGKRSLVNTILV